MISQQRNKKKRKLPQRPHFLMSRMMQDFRHGGGMRGGSSYRGGRGGSFVGSSRFGLQNGLGAPQRFGQPQAGAGQGFGRPQGFGQPPPNFGGPGFVAQQPGYRNMGMMTRYIMILEFFHNCLRLNFKRSFFTIENSIPIITVKNIPNIFSFER